MSAIVVRDATALDAAACAAIYAPYVRDSAITFETGEVDATEMAARIETKAARHAFLVAQAEGRVVGYAYAGEYRARWAWQWAAETSVYVDAQAQRAGVGRALYEALLSRLTARGFVNAIAVVTLPNDASIAFHHRLGFEDAGVLPRAGYKRGAWHDVATLCRRLRDDPGHPALPH